MDRSKRLAVLDSSENIRMVFDYRAIVIPAVPAVFLSRDQEPESSRFSQVGIEL